MNLRGPLGAGNVLTENLLGGAAWLCGWLVLTKIVNLKFGILGNDQRDAHLLYFTIYLLHSSTCFEHFMLIISIMSLNCIDAASGIVLSVSGRPVHRK
jgi:dolichol kinase